MLVRSATNPPTGACVSNFAVGTQASRRRRGRLGASAGAALEGLAIATRPEDRGRVTMIGVHDLSIAIGTRDAAATRTVPALAAAGLDVFAAVIDRNGQHWSRYRFHIPDDIDACCCPPNHDSAYQATMGGCPNDRDTRSASRPDRTESSDDRYPKADFRSEAVRGPDTTAPRDPSPSGPRQQTCRRGQRGQR
jgi:hypothetical protein